MTELVGELKNALKNKTGVIIQTKDIETFDLSGLQALLSLKKTLSMKKLPLRFSDPMSPVFLNVLQQAGVAQQEEISSEHVEKILDQWVQKGIL
jgi:anti-anti-sigma regulatory factor